MEALSFNLISSTFQYKIASTVLSLGGLRQQFSCEENIKMSLFGADFLTNINEYLHVEGEPLVDAQFHQHGYLSLCGRESAHILKKNSELQNSLGARNVLLSQDQLKAKFPWLNVTDVELGCHGLEKEGWFDPWSLLLAFKRKALAMGVVYVRAEAKSFKFQLSKEMVLAGGDKNEEIKSLVVSTISFCFLSVDRLKNEFVLSRWKQRMADRAR